MEDAGNNLIRIILKGCGLTPATTEDDLCPLPSAGFCEYREEIRKSRFITLAAPDQPARPKRRPFIEQHSDLNGHA